MLQQTKVCCHKSGKIREFVHKDPVLAFSRGGAGTRSINRMSINGSGYGGYKRVGHKHANLQYQHAFPLLSHGDFGNNDQSNNTKNIMYSMYMPKRNKGTAPWFRGADTYSVKYSEQGRYEYQRYLMINRFPSSYKKHFLRFLNSINGTYKPQHATTLPQEALHWLYRMIVDNFNPQHVHYEAAMAVLFENKELDMARDVWKLMERQQTIPCTTTISGYLDVCIAAKEKDWALEAWNRYCTELTFLQHGEADPKPISRVPHSLTREELLYLPKWKKHFDHDPNLDVTDLNRFNKTREIYMKMALVLLASGDTQGFFTFFNVLKQAMKDTPTPVPEPPNPYLIRRPRWSPYEKPEDVHASGWRLENTRGANALGQDAARDDVLQHRYLTNEQFLVYTVKEAIRVVSSVDAMQDKAAFVEDLVEMVFKDTRIANLPTESLVTELLRFHMTVGKETGAQLHKRLSGFLERKASLAPRSENEQPITEAPNPTAYLVLLQACAAEGLVDPTTKRRNPAFDPRATMATLAAILTEMHASVKLQWSLDMHLAIVQTLARCGTMKANEYFVKNVLRKFQWTSGFLEALYEEYRRHEDVDMWAELTKRALVWSARYDVQLSEAFKRSVEDDYDIIKVQTRTFRELAVFQFRDVEEKRHARNPVNELPNPWIDYVSHALPFPDRDAGYPDEYGDLGQWRAPGGPGSPTKGPGYYAPKMEGEHLKGYTSEWRDLKNPMKPPAFPNPWERKYKQYARGQHPSYDMVYAGPMPEIFPERHNFRKPTRWDFHDIEKQGKFKMSGPW